LKNIDIIIPAFSKIPRPVGQRLKSLNTDWYPVFLNQFRIKSMGYKIRFLNIYELPKNKLSDSVIIDIRVKKDLMDKGTRPEKKKDIILRFINRIKKMTESLILFDNLDSISILYYTLPYVDFYYKKQLLKDRSLYSKNLFGNRLFTDYYYKKHGIGKKDYNYYENSNNEYEYLKNKNKIGISWNILLAVNNFQTVFSKVLYIFTKKLCIKWGYAGGNKKYIISGNFFKEYKKDIISFQRRKMHEFLLRHRLSKKFSLGIVSKKQYRNIILQSRYVVSPFGWGEICYRDYEAFIAGAALIKPDMSHLETWPNLYRPGETYFPISWDIEKWDDDFEKILSDEENASRVGELGQEEFRNLWSKKGRQQFCERFIKLIDL
jgi:hypothetical protein